MSHEPDSGSDEEPLTRVLPRWDLEPVVMWLTAIELPALGWFQRTLPEAGAPRSIATHPEFLAEVLGSARNQYKALWKSLLKGSTAAGVEMTLSQEVATQALDTIEDRLGRPTSVAFADWARRYVIRSDWKTDLLYWRWIIVTARSETHRPNASGGPPSALAAALRPMNHEFGAEREKSFRERLVSSAPPPGTEDRQLGLDVNPEVLRVEQAAWRHWTREGLAKLHVLLDQRARAEARQWGRRQADEFGFMPTEVFEQLI